MSGARSRLATVVLAVLTVGFFPARAAAGPASGEPTVAVLPVHVEGELEPHVVQQLQDRLTQGIERGEVGVAPIERVREAFAGVDECAASACFAQAARAVGAELAVRAQVVAQGRDYELHVEVLDAADGTVLHKRDATCEICGTAEVVEQLSNEASALVPFVVEYAQARSVLEVKSNPPGARVFVDGKEVGSTPFSGEVADGDRVVEISKPGHATRERRVAVERGATTVIEVELDPLAPPPKTGPHAALGWTPIAVGVGAIGSGLALILIDEDPVAGRCDQPGNVDMFGTCRYRYKTLEGGIALAAGGVALVAVGAVVLGLRAKRAKATGSERTSARWGTHASGLWVRF